MELRLHRLNEYMPPIWKILLFCILCLGLGPIKAQEEPEETNESAITEAEIFESSSNELETLKSEMVSEKDLEPTGSGVSTESPQINTTSQVELSSAIVGEEKFSKDQIDGLERLGIRRLPRGISIFRYNHQKIKNQVSLLKSRTLTEKSVQ